MSWASDFFCLFLMLLCCQGQKFSSKKGLNYPLYVNNVNIDGDVIQLRLSDTPSVVIGERERDACRVLSAMN